ncbi:MAG: AsmA family protein [Pseudohaliea sp.]
MARSLQALLIILVVLALAAIAGLLLVDREHLVAMASQRLEAETGARLTVQGDVALSLFPRLSLALEDATLETPAGGPVLRAGSLGIGLAVMPLVRGSVEIDRLYIEDADVTRVADPAEARAAAAETTVGLSNAELDALYAARREARRLEAGGAEALAAPLALDVGELSLRNVRLRTVDTADETLSLVQLKHFTAEGVNTAGRETPLQLMISIPGGADESPLEIAAVGRLSTDLEAGRLSLPSLAVTVSGPTTAPLELELSGAMDLRRAAGDFQLSLAVDDSRGEGTVRYARYESPMIDASLELNRFTPALLALAGPGAAGGEPAGAGELPYDALRSLDTAARLAIDEVQLGPHRLTGVSATLRAVEGTVTLSDVGGKLHGGSIALAATLDAHYAPATLESRGAVTDLDLASALTALESPVSGNGSASLTWDVNSRGSDSEEFVEALTGPVTLRTDAVTVKDISVQREFCRVVALANGDRLSQPFPRDTAFKALEADVAFGSGRARLERLAASLPGIALAGRGDLALLAGDFTATIGGRLRPALGELDPACAVDERLLALTFPVACEGNLAGEPKDWCTLDAEAVIEDALKNEARKKLEKKAGKLLNKLFDND